MQKVDKVNHHCKHKNHELNIPININFMKTNAGIFEAQIPRKPRYIEVKVGCTIFCLCLAPKNKLDLLRNKNYLFTCAFCFISDPVL